MGCDAFSDPSVPSWPLYVSQGAYYNEPIAWLQADKVTPIPNTGYHARMQVRQTPSAPAVVIDLSSDNGGIILGGANGLLNIVIEQAVTQTLPPGEYVYDIKFTPPNDEPFFWLKGTFTVVATATR